MPSSSQALVCPNFSRRFRLVTKGDCIGYDSFASSPWIVKLVEYVKQVLEQDRVRAIGVCFGHQIIARALGQRVDRGEAGWEVSVMPVELTELGKQLFKQDELVC